MKKDLLFIILIICLANTIIWGIEIKAESSENVEIIQENYYQEEEMESNVELEVAFEEISKYIIENDIPFDFNWNGFVNYYNLGNYNNVQEYKEIYYQLFQPSEDEVYIRGGNNQPWYYDTGETLPLEPNYSEYNLMGIVKPGDLIYEAKGGFHITGHIAVVEGIFYSEEYECFYIRLIEAISSGVCRGVLDDDRINQREGHIIHLTGVTDEQRMDAIEFCKSQLGKSYGINFAYPESGDKSDWYCSELAWASYYLTNGIDLEPEFVQQGPLIQPYEIFLLTSPEHGNEIAIENIPQPFYSPYDLSASVLSENSIKLIWSNDNGECGGYKIYKSTDLEYWYEIGDTTNQEFIDRNVYTEVEYYYTVITYDDYGICSNPSSLERIIITPVLLERPRIYSIV